MREWGKASVRVMAWVMGKVSVRVKAMPWVSRWAWELRWELALGSECRLEAAWRSAMAMVLMLSRRG